jgi:mitochondrial fission protein ELM1
LVDTKYYYKIACHKNKTRNTMTPDTEARPHQEHLIWAVSDGRKGMENQVVGIAEAVARRIRATVVIKQIALPSFLSWLPYEVWGTGLINPLRFLTAKSDSLNPPWPDLFVGCGRLTVASSIAVRRASNGKTYTVQTQDPRVQTSLFDLVLPPFHDELQGPNVLPLLGAPNRVTPITLEEGKDQFASLFTELPRPLAGVLIGGSSKTHQLGPGEMQRIASALKNLATQGVGLAITTSRRTGTENEAILRAALAGTSAWIWDGTGENPYFGLLAHADAILVTADSVNMVTEAAATGKPVHILPLSGGSAKICRFHEAMESRGIARPFSGSLDTWSYAPLRETDRAAETITAALESRASTA